MEPNHEHQAEMQRRHQELRVRAEKRRSITSAIVSEHTPSETRRLVQELQTHQIELEMQYEELLLAQEESERMRQQYTDLYDFAPVGYCTLSARGTIQQLNLCASTLLGYERATLRGHAFPLCVSPAERPKFYEFLQRMLHQEATQHTELQVQRPDGRTLYVRIQGSRLLNEDQEPLFRLALFDDTERHNAIQQVSASEARFRKLFEKSRDAVCLVKGSTYIDCNEAAVRLLGAEHKNQIVGQPIGLLTPEYQPNGQRSAELQQNILTQLQWQGSYRGAWLRHRFSGEPIWLEVVLTRIELDGEPLIHVVWRDETQRKKAEQDLAASEARFRTLFERSNDGMLLLQSGRYIDCNEAALRLIGATSREQIVGQVASAFTPEVQPNGRRTAEWFAENVARAMQEGSLRCEAQMFKPTDEEIWIEAVLTPVRIPEQEPIIHVVWRDVTERRRNEQRLQEGEQRLKTAVRAANMGIGTWDFATERFHLDERGCQMFGWPLPSADLTLAELMQPVHPDDVERATAELLKAAEIGSLDVQVRVVHPSGEVRYVVATGQVIRNLHGTPERMSGVLRDITERYLANLRLRESEERLQLALKASHAGLCHLELATGVLHLDEQANRIYGRPADAGPTTWEDLSQRVHPDDLARVNAAKQHSTETQEPFSEEHRVVWPDGALRYVETSGNVQLDGQGRQVRLIGLLRDVTTRRETQQQLNFKNRLLEHILHNMPVVLTRITADGELLEVAGAGLRRLGVADNVLNGRNVYEAYPKLTNSVNKLLSGNEVRFLGMPPRREGQEQIYFQNYGFFDREQNAGVLFAIDVTDTQQANVQLKAERDFVKSLLDHSGDAIMVFDRNFYITEWNQRAAELTQIPAEDVLGKRIFSDIPAFDRLEFRRIAERVLAGTTVTEYNIPFKRRHGAYDATFVPLADAEDRVANVLGVVRDVTERNRLMEEATRLRLQREKEVLSAIMHTQEDERKRIAEALHNGVGQLLYASKLHLDSTPVDETHRTAAIGLLNEAIKATRTISFELTPNVLEDFGLKSALEELCKRIPKHNLHVHLSVGELPPAMPRLVETAAYRIAQELLNNVIKHAHAREAFVYVELQGNKLHLSVEDDGCGFDVEKAREKRGGIGLSGIRNRVGLLGGELTIRSRQGLGTTITVELPLGEEVKKRKNSKP
ncbi:PAS domain S-box protein [Hymenobacter oligotrophus]|uniref:histidine kinase n=1 Tax=Hymenobacter oligotrophus TaxID=2319843 RepID=A0A3B7RD21_9BACT|nr:PAS domain S-box protein [Hymenobacter oligotrophus]AYA38509.1 PAS domain S-box protein [Hymenobacter oligotrophus]